MMRVQIAPRLRELGFRGSGQSYSLPDETAFVLLGFQKDKYSDADAVPFTVNLTVASKAAWAAARRERPWIGEKPSANTRAGTFAWERRITEVLATRYHDVAPEIWWTVKAGQDTTAVATEVLEIIENDALPAMRDELERSRGRA